MVVSQNIFKREASSTKNKSPYSELMLRNWIDKSFHQHHIDYYDSYTVFEGDILFSLSGSWLNVRLLEQVYILLLTSAAALS